MRLAAEQDLVERLAALLDRTIDQLTHLDEYASHWLARDEGTITLSDKFATEASLLLLLSRRVEATSPGVTRLNDRLAAVLGPLIRSRRLRALLISTPQVAATLGAGHVFLAASGSLDPEFDSLISSAIAAGFDKVVERLPYRQLDQHWTRNLTRRRRLPIVELLRHSILNSRAHPFTMTQSDAYAVTHAIMYATDFGQVALPATLNRSRVKSMIESGISWHLLSQDFDLLVEYLMCAECLEMRDAPAARLGWHVVRTLWDDIGFVPGPTFDAARYRVLEGSAAEAYAVEHMYHTNFVTGMYCAVRLGRGGATPASSAASDGLRDELETLLGDTLSIEGTSASPETPWFKALDDAPISDDQLLPVIWEASVIDAVRRGDWAAAVRLRGRTPRGASRTTSRELDWLHRRILEFPSGLQVRPRERVLDRIGRAVDPRRPQARAARRLIHE